MASGLLKCTLSAPEPGSLLTILSPALPSLCSPVHVPREASGAMAAAKVAAPPLRVLRLTAPATLTPGPAQGGPSL